MTAFDSASHAICSSGGKIWDTIVVIPSATKPIPAIRAAPFFLFLLVPLMFCHNAANHAFTVFNTSLGFDTYVLA